MKINSIKDYSILYKSQKNKNSDSEKVSQQVSDLSLMPHYKIAFQGALKNNLRLGENCLKEFTREFPYIHSNTFWEVKMEKHKDNSEYKYLVPNIEKVARKYSQIVQKTRYIMDTNFYSSDNYIKKLKNTIRLTNAANCDECADILLWNLMQKNIPAHKIYMSICDKNTKREKELGDHLFNLIGLQKGADIRNPKTWGNSAVIIDGWKKCVMPAKDALEMYKTEFGFDTDKHFIRFSPKDFSYDSK